MPRDRVFKCNSKLFSFYFPARIPPTAGPGRAQLQRFRPAQGGADRALPPPPGPGMAEYSCVKSTKLVLKGSKGKR